MYAQLMEMKGKGCTDKNNAYTYACPIALATDNVLSESTILRRIKYSYVKRQQYHWIMLLKSIYVRFWPYLY